MVMVVMVVLMMPVVMAVVVMLAVVMAVVMFLLLLVVFVVFFCILLLCTPFGDSRHRNLQLRLLKLELAILQQLPLHPLRLPQQLLP